MLQAPVPSGLICAWGQTRSQLRMGHLQPRKTLRTPGGKGSIPRLPCNADFALRTQGALSISLQVDAVDPAPTASPLPVSLVCGQLWSKRAVSTAGYPESQTDRLIGRHTGQSQEGYCSKICMCLFVCFLPLWCRELNPGHSP